MGLKPSTFERTKVRSTVLVQVRVCVKRNAFELIQARSNACVQCIGCVQALRSNFTKAKSNAAPSGRSNLHGYVRTCTIFFFF
jgi:hypothetical protein